MKRFVLVLAAVAALTSPASAERMSGQEVATMLGQGVTFQAGSRWTTQSGGRFVFDHGSAREAGTFQVFGSGEVEMRDARTGETARFYFDRGADGVPTLTYLSGKSRGQRYPIKQ